jgi:hypothetical protein
LRAVLPLAFTVACLAAIGWYVLPNVFGAGQWLLASDAATFTRLGLTSALSPQRLNSEMKTALDNKEKYLADSIIELAKQEGVAIDAALIERYNRETGGFTAPLERVVQGLWDGKCTSVEGFAAGKLSDLLVIGDVRDLYNEVEKFRAGQAVDDLVIALAAFGIVSTAAVPIHTAASTIKGLAKADRLSPAFREELKNALTSAVDTRAVMQAVPKFDWWDTLPSIGWNSWHPDLSWPLLTEKLPQLVAAMQTGINLGKLTAFNRMTGDVVTIASAAGICAAQDALALSHNSADLEKIARLAETRRGATAAVLKLLGREAFVMAETRKSEAMIWVGGGVAYLMLGALALLLAARSARRR